MLSFNCPSCNKRLKVQDDARGKKVQCKCGQRIVVPDSSLAEQENPKPPTRETTITSKPKSKPASMPEVPQTSMVVAKQSPVVTQQVMVNRNLITCPACHTSVSRQALRCPSCGHKLRKAKRGLFGQIFKWAFILFNVYMVYVMFQVSKATGEMLTNADNEAQRAGTAIGAGLGMGMVIFLWVAGDVILGLFVLFTSPRE